MLLCGAECGTSFVREYAFSAYVDLYVVQRMTQCSLHGPTYKRNLLSSGNWRKSMKSSVASCPRSISLSKRLGASERLRKKFSPSDKSSSVWRSKAIIIAFSKSFARLSSSASSTSSSGIITLLEGGCGVSVKTWAGFSSTLKDPLLNVKLGLGWYGDIGSNTDGKLSFVDSGSIFNRGLEMCIDGENFCCAGASFGQIVLGEGVPGTSKLELF
mmetsp:Transcript_967/g.1776  ORF Transcript_967/g.1776 Transcript_967/m.1776 type:complete len:214 (+) Transcript_967:470-1111(+)